MTTLPSSAGALAGIKVLDLSRVLAGPWCTQVLADLGADVVKVERPGLGDDTRQWGPPFLKDAEGNDTTQASYFTACNRNKRSVTVDMATPEGRWQINAQASYGLKVPGCQIRFRLVQFFQNTSATDKIGFAFGGEVDTTGRPVQKLCPQPGLQLRHVPGNRRLGHVQRLRRADKRPGLHHRGEHTHFLELVHRVLLIQFTEYSNSFMTVYISLRDF